MRLKAALQGSLSEYLQHEFQQGAEAVTIGIKNAINGLKMSMRGQVRSAGLGSRLANTWREDVYPQTKKSISAAGVIYTKAQKIMSCFEYQSTIRSSQGFWLAIPTPAVKKRISGKRMTPALYERSKCIRLRFVYRPRGASLLVHEQKRKTIIAFWLVPQVKMPKLINFETESLKWQNKLPTLILQNWKDDEQT